MQLRTRSVNNFSPLAMQAT